MVAAMATIAAAYLRSFAGPFLAQAADLLDRGVDRVGNADGGRDAGDLEGAGGRRARRHHEPQLLTGVPQPLAKLEYDVDARAVEILDIALVEHEAERIVRH